MRITCCLALGVVAWLGVARGAELAPLPAVTRADLLQHNSVQKELQLSAEQTRKLREAFLQHRDEMQDIWQKFPPQEASTKWQEMSRDLKTTALALLTEEQRKRFWQIDFQSSVAMAFDSSTFARPEIDQRIGLTDKQREQLRGILTESNKRNQEVFQSRDQKRIWSEPPKIRKDDKEKVAAVLTDEQKKKWQDLVGKPFVVTQFDAFADLRAALGKWIRDDFGRAQAESRKTGKPIFALFRCEP
jgi:hypothetical protein